MKFAIQSALVELKQRNIKGYSIDYLNWWLLKYTDLKIHALFPNSIIFFLKIAR